MASIFTDNMTNVTVQPSASTDADREVRKDTSSNVEIANSGNAAPDNQVVMHESDKKNLEKYGIVS